jgi:hypothetical protein
MQREKRGMNANVQVIVLKEILEIDSEIAEDSNRR